MEGRMKKQRLVGCILGALLVLAAARETWATWYAGNALAVTDTSQQVTFSATQCGGSCSTMAFYNSGTQTAYVKTFDACETIAAITTTTPGAFAVVSGATVEAAYSISTECASGTGYKGFARIAAAGQSATLYVVGK